MMGYIGFMAKHMKAALLGICVSVVLMGCGQEKTNTPPATGFISSSPANALVVGGQAWVGVQEYVDSGVLMPLRAGLVSAVLQSVTWQQITGPEAALFNKNNGTKWVLLPFVSVPTELVFEAHLVAQGGQAYTVQQTVMVMPLQPQITLNNLWLENTANSVALSANFDHSVFTQFQNGLNLTAEVVAPISWITPTAELNNLFSHLPTQVLFAGNRQGELLLDLRSEPLSPASQNSPANAVTHTVQFYILLPNGQRAPVTLLVMLAPSVGVGSSIATSSGATSASAQNTASSSVSNLGSASSLGESSLGESSLGESSLGESSVAVSSLTANSTSVGTLQPSSLSLGSSSSVGSLGSSLSLASSSSLASVSSLAALEQAITNICEGDVGVTTQPLLARVDNPFVGAVGYIDADFTAKVGQSQQLAAGNTALIAAMEMVKNQPTGVWLDGAQKLCGRPADGRQNFVEHLKAAQAQAQQAGQPAVLTAVVYNLPARDCVRQERPSELPATAEGLLQYQAFIDRIAALVGLFPDVRVAAIVEPTAFATLVSYGGTVFTQCEQTNAKEWYRQGLTYAVQQFAQQPSLYGYLEYGDSGWPGSFNGEQALADFWRSTLLPDGRSPIAGISLNVGGYVPLHEPFMLSQSGDGTAYSLPKGVLDMTQYTQYLANYWQGEFGEPLAMLVDTSRNGWGGALWPTTQAIGEEARVDRRPQRDAWCNVDGAGLGELPVAAPTAKLQAYIWAYPPGVSSGNTVWDCQHEYNWTVSIPLAGAPTAGQWFPAHFEQLINNAYPALIAPQLPVNPIALNLKAKVLRMPVRNLGDIQVGFELPQGLNLKQLTVSYAGKNLALPMGWQGASQFYMGLDTLEWS